MNPFEKLGLTGGQKEPSLDQELLRRRVGVGEVIKVIAYKIEPPEELQEEAAIVKFLEEKYADVERVTEEAKKGNFIPAQEWMEKNADQITDPGRLAFEMALSKANEVR